MTKALGGISLSSACCVLTVSLIGGMWPTPEKLLFNESQSVGMEEMFFRDFDIGGPGDVDLRQKAPPEATDFQLREGERCPLSVCARACVHFDLFGIFPDWCLLTTAWRQGEQGWTKQSLFNLAPPGTQCLFTQTLNM